MTLSNIPRTSPARWSGVLSFSPRRPWWRYALRMWLVGFLPALVISAVVRIPGFSRRTDGTGAGDPDYSFRHAFSTVVFAPVAETLILAAMVGLLARWIRNPNAIAAICSGIWGVLHSLSWAPWGIIIAWPFFVWTRVFIASSEEEGILFALAVAATIHALQNLPGALAMFWL